MRSGWQSASLSSLFLVMPQGSETSDSGPAGQKVHGGGAEQEIPDATVHV